MPSRRRGRERQLAKRGVRPSARAATPWWAWPTIAALRHRPITLLVVALVTVAGYLAWSDLNRELFPELDVPVMTVVTPYVGADPVAVADLVTEPLEDLVANLDGLRGTYALSQPGVSILVAEFDYGTPVGERVIELTRELDTLRLPEGAGPSRIEEVAMDEFPMLRLSLVAMDGADPDRLSELAKDLVVPRLSGLDGVRTVRTAGTVSSRLVVEVKPEALVEKGVSVGQVTTALKAANLAIPSGVIGQADREIPVRVGHRLTSVEAVADLPVGPRNPGGAPIPVADGQSTPGRAPPSPAPGTETAHEQRTHLVREGETLSELAYLYYRDADAWPRIISANQSIRDPRSIRPGQRLVVPTGATAVPSTGSSSGGEQQGVVRVRDIAAVRWESQRGGSITRTDGRDSVSILVFPRAGADLVSTTSRVRRELDGLAPTLERAGGEIAIIRDQAKFVEASLRDVSREGLLGGLLAVLVIAAFLRSPRSTAVVAVSIPISLMLTFLVLQGRGMSLNLMTLGGLAVSLGRLVDDAIVVLESVHRHRRQGEMPLAAALSGTKEVGGAVIVATLTGTAVFAPLALVGGVVGQAFRPFAITASVALLSSLVVALTIVPVLGSFLGAVERVGSASRLENLYSRAIAWSLRHRALVASATLLAALGVWLLIAQVPTTFLPSPAEKLLQVQVRMPPGTPAATTAAAASEVERLLARAPEVETYELSVGDSGSLAGATGFGLGSPSEGDIFVRLRSDAQVEEVVARLRSEFAGVPAGGETTVAPLESQGAVENRLQLVVTGGDAPTLSTVVDELKGDLERVSGLADVRDDASESRSDLSVAVNPEKAAAHALTPAQVASTLREMLSGQTATTISVEEKPVDVVVRLDTAEIEDADRLAGLMVGGSRPVRLGDIAEVALVQGPARLVRRDGRSAVTITASIIESNTGPVNAEVRRLVEERRLPEGVEVQVGGVLEEQTTGFESLGLALAAAVGLAYLVMVIGLGSVVLPAVVMATLPLAGLGALAALYLMGRPIGMSALIGLLMLVGIVVANAIVLLVRVRQLLGGRWGVDSALVEAGRTRARPILMTAITTMLGLSPLALGAAEGTLLAEEMATVVIGGLALSAALTPMLVAVVYSLARRALPAARS